MTEGDDHVAAGAVADNDDEIGALAQRFIGFSAEPATADAGAAATETFCGFVPPEIANRDCAPPLRVVPFIVRRVVPLDRTKLPRIRRDPTQAPAAIVALPTARPAVNGHAAAPPTSGWDHAVSSGAEPPVEHRAASPHTVDGHAATSLRIAASMARRINARYRTRPTVMRRKRGTAPPPTDPASATVPRSAVFPKMPPRAGAAFAYPLIVVQSTKPEQATPLLPDRAMMLASFPTVIYEPEFVEAAVFPETAAAAPTSPVPTPEPVFTLTLTSAALPSAPKPAPEPTAALDPTPPAPTSGDCRKGTAATVG